MLTEVHVPDDVADAVRPDRRGRHGHRRRHERDAVAQRLRVAADRARQPAPQPGLAGVQRDRLDRRRSARRRPSSQVEHDARLEILNPVVRSIASVPVRTLATVGGNLFARQPHGDLAVALVALDARVTLVDETGTRELPVEEFVAADPPAGARHRGRLRAPRSGHLQIRQGRPPPLQLRVHRHGRRDDHRVRRTSSPARASPSAVSARASSGRTPSRRPSSVKRLTDATVASGRAGRPGRDRAGRRRLRLRLVSHARLPRPPPPSAARPLTADQDPPCR